MANEEISFIPLMIWFLITIQVEELGSAKMEWSVVFFNPGQYKMSVQCTSQGKHTWKLVPPIEFDVQDS